LIVFAEKSRFQVQYARKLGKPQGKAGDLQLTRDASVTVLMVCRSRRRGWFIASTTESTGATGTRCSSSKRMVSSSLDVEAIHFIRLSAIPRRCRLGPGQRAPD
jgi:hypothetical protein